MTERGPSDRDRSGRQRIERLDVRVRPWVKAVFSYDPALGRPNVAFPTGGTNLIARLEGNRRRPEVTELIYIGLRTGPVPIPEPPKCTFVGIALSPGAAPALLRPDAGTLVDDCVSLADLDARLRERLVRTLEAGTAATAPRRLAAGLVEALGVPLSAVEPRVTEAARLLGRRGSIAAVADHVEISRQHLGNLFRQYVGVGPKRYARMVRFRATLRAALDEPDASLADLALRFGYCDQSHVHRDFLEFGGAPPAQLIRRQRGATEAEAV